MYFCIVLCIVFCVVLCIVCVYMCTVLLLSGGYPIVVKYIISYRIISYHKSTEMARTFPPLNIILQSEYQFNS